jgi:GAF domain-containing protein
MQSAPSPENESSRLTELQQYTVLDTPPETAFDELTALAAQICGTPIALVSLIDAHRQWFKAKVGIDAPETSRDIVFILFQPLPPSGGVTSSPRGITETALWFSSVPCF